MLNLVPEPSSYSVREALCAHWTKNDNCVCVVRYLHVYCIAHAVSIVCVI